MAKAKVKTKETKSIVAAGATDNYKVSDVRTPSGRKTLDCDDAVARQLRGKEPAELKAIAAKAGLAERFKGWEKLNAGQCRMALGNALRAIARVKAAPKKAAA